MSPWNPIYSLWWGCGIWGQSLWSWTCWHENEPDSFSPNLHNNWWWLQQQALEAGHSEIVRVIVALVIYQRSKDSLCGKVCLSQSSKNYGTLVTEYGINSPYFTNMLSNLFCSVSILNSYTMTPHDLKLLSQLLLSMQYTLWEAELKKLLEVSIFNLCKKYKSASYCLTTWSPHGERAAFTAGCSGKRNAMGSFRWY